MKLLPPIDRKTHFIYAFFYDSRYSFLVASLFLTIVIPVNNDGGLFGQIVDFFLLMFLLLSGVSFMQRYIKFLRWVVFLSIIAVVFESLAFIGLKQSVVRNLVRFGACFVFVILLSISLVQDMRRRPRVDIKMIMGAVAGYLLLGLLGYYLYAGTELLHPGSFSLNGDSIVISDLLYFSYITITTTGYGDILPVTGIAQRLAFFFAIVGQIYTTIIIAILVARYISHSNDARSERVAEEESEMLESNKSEKERK